MKTAEELNVIKGEVETVRRKLNELIDEELAQVSGGRPNGLGPEFGCEAGEFVADAYKDLMSDKSHPGFVMSEPGGSKTVCG